MHPYSGGNLIVATCQDRHDLVAIHTLCYWHVPRADPLTTSQELDIALASRPLVTHWGRRGLLHPSGYSFPSSDSDEDSTGLTAWGLGSPSSRSDSLPLEVTLLPAVATAGGPVGLAFFRNRTARDLSLGHRLLCASRARRRGFNLGHSSAQWPVWLHCQHGKLDASPLPPFWSRVDVATLCSLGSVRVVLGRTG